MGNQTTKKVVVVGGGFAGVRLARQLARRRDVSVTLVSDRDSFAYYPQLYHAATGGARSESAIPLAELFAGSAVELVIDTAVSFDPKAKTLTTAGKQVLEYSYLAFGLGNVTNYFGITGLEDYSYNIKSIDGAERFKQHLHQELIEQKGPEAHYVIVGAGPTGVELAAALGTYLQRIAKLHGVADPQYRVDLVEASPKVLPRSSDAVSAQVQRRLEQLGVTVMTSAVVEGETATTLKLKGKAITTQTVVWTAGVANNPFYKQNEQRFILVKGNHVQVDEYLQTANGVYVMGDNAATPFSGLAQTAIHDADFVAADIGRRLDHKLRPAYKPKRPVAVTPVGHGWAAVEWGGLHFAGYLGWLVRRAADLVAYHDIERLPAALHVWLQEPHREEDCPICQKNEVVA
jgi:NADH:quinone reductase (non-electrogenic)